MMSKPSRRMLVPASVAAIIGLIFAVSRLQAQEVTVPLDGAVIGTAYVDATGCRPWEYGRPDLFYNFYVPNNCGGVPAQLYIAPRPVPPLVGHTYYTYQPFMPHEFTYHHNRTYRRYYDEGRGMTRTSATWYFNPVTATLQSARQAIKIPR
jgi:hypothetical protein